LSVSVAASNRRLASFMLQAMVETANSTPGETRVIAVKEHD
jgi:hypothetical protein